MNTLEEAMAKQHELMATWWSLDLAMLGRWIAVPGCHCATCADGAERGPRGLASSHLVASQVATKKGLKPVAVLGCGCETCAKLAETFVERALEPRTQLAEAFVERTLSCPTCRREFCRVVAPEKAAITVLCEGCIREGR